MLLEKSEEVVPEGMKRLSQSENNPQYLVVKVKPDSVRTVLHRNLEY